MKRLILPIISLILICSFGCGGNRTENSTSNITETVIDSINSLPKDPASFKTYEFMDLYYGMERSGSGYTFTDSVLDNTDGLIGHNYYDTIFDKSDLCKSRVSLGLYMDGSYPNKIVQSRIEETVDTVICNSLGYYMEDINEYCKNKSYPSDSIENFFTFWESIFHQIIASNSDTLSSGEYYDRLEARVCVLSHKIYEDSVWATYIIESTTDYHGSCGCGSVAEYISYNKDIGSILTLQDIIKQHSDIDLANTLWEKYTQIAYENGYTPNEYYRSNSLMQYVDGVAYTPKGVLFYFKPYNIGCGAEGQYNLLIQL